MKVALIQIDVVWENKPANLQHAEALIAGLPKDVRLAVLPEMFNTGFSMRPERVAEDEEGLTLTWMKATAQKYQLAIVGSISFAHSNCYSNRLFFVFPDGTYQSYDKRHLFRYGQEQEHYTAGTERLIVEYEGWRICPLVCYDLRFPIWSRNVIPDSKQPAYDLLLYIASWPSIRIQAWNLLLPARAVENQSYVIGVNRTSTDLSLTGERHFSGESQAIDFKGNILAKTAMHTEEALVVNLDLQLLHDFSAHFPAWLDGDRFSIDL